MIGSVSAVTLCNVLVQGVGVLRMMIIASALGMSAPVDAYYLGLALPSLGVVVMSAWVQSTFLGRYTQLLSESNAAASNFQFSFLVLLGTTLVVLGGLWWLAADRVLYSAGSAAVAAAGSGVVGALALLLLFSSLADFFGQVQHGHQRYLLPAMALVANAVVSTLALYLWPVKDLQALIDSLLLGALTQLLVVIPGYLRVVLRAHPLRAWRVDRAELAAVLRLTGPLVPALLLGNAVFTLVQFALAQLGDGAVATFNYANRIYSGLAQLLILGFGTVLLPFFAETIATQNQAGLVQAMRRLTRGTVVVSGVVVVGVYLFAEPVVELLFGRGAFTTEAVSAVSLVLLLLCLGLLPRALGTFVARYFSAQRRTDLLMISSALGFGVTALGAAFGIWLGSLNVIVLGVGAAFVVSLWFWLFKLCSIMSLQPLLNDLARSVLALLLLVPLLLLDLWLKSAVSGDLVGLVLRLGAFGGGLAALILTLRGWRWVMVST